MSIVVTGSNDPPSANDGSAATVKDTPVAVSLSGTDPDTCDLMFTIESNATHGVLGTVADASCSPGAPNTDTATIQYTPESGYTGSDSFTFSVFDGTSTSNVATVTITVSEPGAGIAFRSSSAGSNATALTLDIGRPIGAIPGDVMVAVVDVRGSPGITPPTGWMLVRMDGSLRRCAKHCS